MRNYIIKKVAGRSGHLHPHAGNTPNTSEPTGGDWKQCYSYESAVFE